MRAKRLSEDRPENGQRCLVYMGYGWRELYFFRLHQSGLPEGFYTYNDVFINPFGRDPFWMESPPYPEDNNAN